MTRRIVRLYEIHFSDEKSIQTELHKILLDSIDVIKETRKSLLVASYDLECQRRIVNQMLKEEQLIRVKDGDILWDYFSPDLTQNSQTQFRSFYVDSVDYEKDSIIFVTSLTYEKARKWFDLKK